MWLRIIFFRIFNDLKNNNNTVIFTLQYNYNPRELIVNFIYMLCYLNKATNFMNSPNWHVNSKAQEWGEKNKTKQIPSHIALIK